MKCPKCGAAMKQVEKDTMSGYDIREHQCVACGHELTENRGKALWQVIAEGRDAPAKRSPVSTFWHWLRGR